MGDQGCSHCVGDVKPRLPAQGCWNGVYSDYRRAKLALQDVPIEFAPVPNGLAFTVPKDTLAGEHTVVVTADSVRLQGSIAVNPRVNGAVLEGSSIAKDVRIAVQPHLEGESTIVPAGKGWPDWRHALRLRYSRELLTLLASLAERHAEIELCDHLHIFRMAEPMLSWFDAFDDEILVSDSVAALRVRLFAARLKATLKHHDDAV